MVNFKAQLKEIKAFVFDMDGVLTDGTMLVMPDGEMLRRMHFRDGYAMQLAIKKGFKIAIISGGRAAGVTERFEKLGVSHIYLAVSEKIEKYEEFLKLTELNDNQVIYMGDDIPDYQVMKRVGVPTCPSDASEEIKQISKYVSNKKGGEGCVRDIIEQTMKMQGSWMTDDSFVW
ncbi:MAG: HAD-IIIA family hydrolase [Bacteroidota bacterium]